MVSGTDLFYFVMNYSYPYPIDLEGKLVLYRVYSRGSLR